MKAVIVEIKNSFAAALCDDGCIIKVKNKNYGIGQVIEMKQQNFKNITMKKIVSLTAGVAAVVMVSSVSALAYFTPNAYVSLDVNPSIEYSVNRFNRVISATAINGDGTEILDELNLENKKIEDAIKETIAEISKSSYFDGEYLNTVMIATYSDSDKTSEKLAAFLQENADELEVVETETEQTETTTSTETGTKIETETETETEQTESEQAEIEIEIVSIGQARVQEAKDLGVTPGKLNLVQKLQASSENPDNIDINVWLTKPVKEIMKATKENKKSQKTLEETEVSTSESTEVIASTEAETNQTESTTSKTELETIKAIEKAKIETIKAIEKNKIESIKAIEKTERESSKATAESERESVKVTAESERESVKATAESERESVKATAESERESIKAEQESKRESIKAEPKDEKPENNINSNGKNK